MHIRRANTTDIPFLITGILEIESCGESNTYNHLFGTDTQTTIQLLTQIFEDVENTGTELSLDCFVVAEIEGAAAGFCSLIFTNAAYYANKGELFPIHLSSSQLQHFISTARQLPDQRPQSENKYFIEYIYTAAIYRKRGIAGALIQHQIKNTPEQDVCINVFKNKPELVTYYSHFGFLPYAEVAIDNDNTTVYPAQAKIILQLQKNPT